MPAHKDFIPNKLSFDVQEANRTIDIIIDRHLDKLSAALRDIVMQEIFNNGNGSPEMKYSAMAQVKETKRMYRRNFLYLEVGIDLKKLKGASETLFTRVSVVLHGNKASGPLVTKPGQNTWKKHVKDKGPSHAETVWDLPDGFAQVDVMGDIVDGIASNTARNIQRVVNGFIEAVTYDINKITWYSYVNVSKGG